MPPAAQISYLELAAIVKIGYLLTCNPERAPLEDWAGMEPASEPKTSGYK